MPILFRLLCLLIVVRVLIPPGMCMCKLSVPAARLCVVLFNTGQEVPPVAPDHDDHHPGCPDSPLSAALGIKPSDIPQHAIAFAAVSLDTTPEAPTLAVDECWQPPPLAWPPEANLYLTHCSFLI